MEDNNKLEALLETLKQQRDELQLQAHLARANARDDWELLEKRWQQLEHKLAAAGKEARDSSSEVGSAIKLLADEVAAAFKRINNKLH